MANIGNLVNLIRQAIRGLDIRSSITDGIEAINNEVESTTQKQTTLETNMNTLASNLNAAESIRVNSENTRVSNEASRYTAKPNRVTEFNNMKAAYDAATHENTAVELTDARHDSINNKDFNSIGARFSDIATSLNEMTNYLDFYNLNARKLNRVIPLTFNSDVGHFSSYTGNKACDGIFETDNAASSGFGCIPSITNFLKFRYADRSCDRR